MATETAGTFSPSITNPLGYTGLIQFGKSAAKDVGTTTGALRNMSAVEQLVYVFKYLDEKIKQYGAIDSESKLYAAVGAGNYSANDQAVKFRQGQRGYALNKNVWDVNRDGMIQQWEFGPAAQSHLGAGQIFSINDAFSKLAAPTLPNFTQAVTVATSALQALAHGGATGTNNTAAPVSATDTSNNEPFATATADAEQLLETTIDLGDATELWKYQIQAVPKAMQQVNTAIDNTAPKYKGLSVELKRLGLNSKNVGAAFEDAFVGAFQHIDQGLKGIALDFSQAFLQDLEQIVLKKFAHQMYQELSDVLGKLLGHGQQGQSGNQTGGGGFLGSVFNFIGGLFGGHQNNNSQDLSKSQDANTKALELSTGKIGESIIQTALQVAGLTINDTTTTIDTTATTVNTAAVTALTVATTALTAVMVEQAASSFLKDVFDIAGDVGKGAASGGFFPATPGGQKLTIAEGGYDEVVLSTDPSQRGRMQSLLQAYLQRTSFTPNFVNGSMGGSARAGGAGSAGGGNQSGAETHVHHHTHTHNHEWNVNAPAGAQSFLARETQSQIERRTAQSVERGARKW
jgi:hypothetical protein